MPVKLGKSGAPLINKGHTKDKCWKKHGKPKWATKRDERFECFLHLQCPTAECIAQTTLASVTLSHEDFEHLLKMNHGDASLPFAALSNSSILHTPPSSQGKRLIDSGATDHMTSLSSLFVNYFPFCYPIFVSLADGSKIPTIGKGSVSINPNLCVHDVILVPSFPMNLLSIKKLCTTSLCQVFFNSAYCVLQDIRTKRVIGRGLSDGSL